MCLCLLRLKRSTLKQQINPFPRTSVLPERENKSANVGDVMAAAMKSSRFVSGHLNGTSAHLRTITISPRFISYIKLRLGTRRNIYLFLTFYNNRAGNVTLTKLGAEYFMKSSSTSTRHKPESKWFSWMSFQFHIFSETLLRKRPQHNLPCHLVSLHEELLRSPESTTCFRNKVQGIPSSVPK